MENETKNTKNIPTIAPGAIYEQLIERSLRIAPPSWPLQNIVAVNPFWFLRGESFDQVFTKLAPTLHASLFMPIEYFLDRIHSGKITESAIRDALRQNLREGSSDGLNVRTFLEECRVASTQLSPLKTLSEWDCIDPSVNTAIIADIGKHCAGYLDDRQAIARHPWQNLTFWNAWLAAQEYDLSLDRFILVGTKKALGEISGMTSENAIAFMLEKLGLPPASHEAYLQRLTASVLGWASQFRYGEWQKSLGYIVPRVAECRDLLAVRLSYDFLLSRSSRLARTEDLQNWAHHFLKSQHSDSRHSYLLSVLQASAELSYQEEVSRQIALRTSRRTNLPSAQFAFCIDVRSEIYRRHLESVDSSFQTIGFAGFFGIAFDYQRIGEKNVAHRLPVLLAPAFKVKESSREKGSRVTARLRNQKVMSYFRRLRKNPISSFLYVELFGALYIEKILSKTFHALVERIRGRAIPERLEPEFGPDPATIQFRDGTLPTLQEKVERLAGILNHLGITRDFAEFVWIVGHGSVSTNNAFASSLDCGACGGHAGDINARLIVDLLNQASIREGLKARGILVPETTWFIAAMHETVTNEIYPLDLNRVPESHREKVISITEKLQTASTAADQERIHRLPLNECDPFRRSHNWSEVRPEWGLVGNASFIVAPRERTSGIDLDGRAFLHDYDWNKDAVSDFKTLELVMTAPMVVTNWINLQYYASSVAPNVYGSGNKILHNLTNECGVVEGNGGDLRVGLPIQSVHDGSRLMHEPLRLSVFIEAPMTEIEKIIARHATVRELAENGWIHILQIEPGTSQISLRSRNGTYLPRDGSTELRVSS